MNRSRLELTLLILSTLMLAPSGGRPDSPTGNPLGIPRPLVSTAPTPGRTVTRKVDAARSRVQQACRQMEALGIPQLGCEEAEAILDIPGHLGPRRFLILLEPFARMTS